MMVAHSLLLALATVGLQDIPFEAPAEAGLRQLPFMAFACGDDYNVVIEYSDKKNVFILLPSEKTDVKATDPAKASIGSARIKQIDGGAEFTLRPLDATQVELAFFVAPGKPVTGSLSLDGGQTKIACRRLPPAPGRTS